MLEDFKNAISDGVSNNFDKASAECCEDITLNQQSVNYLTLKLNSLTESARLLYLSDKEITPELAEALAEMWDLCSAYIEMYENYSRL